MHRLVFARRTRRLRRLPSLVRQRHQLPVRRIAGITLLEFLGLRANPSIGRVWRRWSPTTAPVDDLPGILEVEPNAPGPARPAVAVSVPETDERVTTAPPIEARVSPARPPARGQADSFPPPPAEPGPAISLEPPTGAAAPAPSLVTRLLDAGRAAVRRVLGDGQAAPAPARREPATGADEATAGTSERTAPVAISGTPPAPAPSPDLLRVEETVAAVLPGEGPRSVVPQPPESLHPRTPAAPPPPVLDRTVPVETADAPAPSDMAGTSMVADSGGLAATEPESSEPLTADPFIIDTTAPFSEAVRSEPPGADRIAEPAPEVEGQNFLADKGDAEPVSAPAAQRGTAEPLPPSGAPPARTIRVAEEHRPRRPPPGRQAPRPAALEPSTTLSAEAELEIGPVDPATLFVPRPEGRNVSDWLARLRAAAAGAEAAPVAGRGADQPAPPVVRPVRARPASPTTASLPPPTAPTPSARRFLRPLVGIDPAEATIHRGPQAERTAAAWSAAALVRGEEIVLGPTGPETAPETLGLLAHELTHVARRRSPRFVPPILRQPSAGAVDATDEEAVAGQVEASVRSLARRVSKPPVETGIAPTPGEPLPPAPDDPGAEPAVVESGPAAARSAWGDLPAPWEPMPAFVWSAPTWAPPAGGATPDAAPTAAPSSAGGAGVAVHRAALDRPEAESGDHAPPSASDAGRPQPDLDTLARQVYAVLRRRLAAERRREG